MEKPERRKLAAADLVRKGFGIVMVVLYIFIGTTIIFKAPDMVNMPTSYGIIFGIMLILYGIYRGYKLFRTYTSAPEE